MTPKAFTGNTFVREVTTDAVAVTDDLHLVAKVTVQGSLVSSEQ